MNLPLRVTLRFVWYDLWVGLRVDRKGRRLYVCPLPCVLITLSPKVDPRLERLGRDALEVAYWRGYESGIKRAAEHVQEFVGENTKRPEG